MLPIIGMGISVIFFFLATIYYPGGSQHNHYSTSYSWEHNYWCNLLYKNALNGEKNAARPLAILSMLFLNISIAGFWFIFPNRIHLTLSKRHLIQFSGTLSMIIATFISSKFHDLIIILSSFLGLIALVGTIIALFELKWKVLFYFGIINVILVFLNFFFYYREDLIYYLPVLQKFTFLLYLLWIAIMAYKMSAKQK